MLAVAAVLGEFCCFCSCSSSLVLRPTATRAFSLCTVSSLQLLQLCSLQVQTSLSLQLLAYSFSAILLECCGFFQPYSSSVAVFLRSLNRVLRFFLPYSSSVAVFLPYSSSVAVFFCLTPQVLRFFSPTPQVLRFFFCLTPQVLRFFFPTPQVLRFFSLLLKCCGFFCPTPQVLQFLSVSPTAQVLQFSSSVALDSAPVLKYCTLSGS